MRSLDFLCAFLDFFVYPRIRSPRKKSITFEQDGVFMPIFPLFY